MSGFFKDWFDKLNAEKRTDNVVEMPHVTILGNIAYNDEAAEFSFVFKNGQSFTFKK